MPGFTNEEARAIAQQALTAFPRVISNDRKVYSYDGEAGQLAIYVHACGPHAYEVSITDATQEQVTEAPLQGFGTTEDLAIVAALTEQPNTELFAEPEGLLF